MGILKEMAARGGYYIDRGTNDPDLWSKLMIDEMGQNVKPFLKEIRQWSLFMAQRKAGVRAIKINCWDFHKCGRNIENKREDGSGICPALLETGLNGIHGGKNGGRVCWIIPGTLCGGWTQRKLVPKYVLCRLCNFKKTVFKDERPDSILSDRFLNMLIH
jgi:hypothetical protein